jgi:hypothetical protein
MAPSGNFFRELILLHKMAVKKPHGSIVKECGQRESRVSDVSFSSGQTLSAPNIECELPRGRKAGGLRNRDEMAGTGRGSWRTDTMAVTYFLRPEGFLPRGVWIQSMPRGGLPLSGSQWVSANLLSIALTYPSLSMRTFNTGCLPFSEQSPLGCKRWGRLRDGGRAEGFFPQGKWN